MRLPALIQYPQDQTFGLPPACMKQQRLNVTCDLMDIYPSHLATVVGSPRLSWPRSSPQLIKSWGLGGRLYLRKVKNDVWLDRDDIGVIVENVHAWNETFWGKPKIDLLRGFERAVGSGIHALDGSRSWKRERTRLQKLFKSGDGESGFYSTGLESVADGLKSRRKVVMFDYDDLIRVLNSGGWGSGISIADLEEVFNLNELKFLFDRTRWDGLFEWTDREMALLEELWTTPQVLEELEKPVVELPQPDLIVAKPRSWRDWLAQLFGLCDQDQTALPPSIPSLLDESVPDGGLPSTRGSKMAPSSLSLELAGKLPTSRNGAHQGRKINAQLVSFLDTVAAAKGSSAPTTPPIKDLAISTTRQLYPQPTPSIPKPVKKSTSQLTPAKKIISIPLPNKIHFIHFNKYFRSPRHLCGVESAARHNPNHTVTLHVMNPDSVESEISLWRRHLPPSISDRVKITRVNYSNSFEGTPLEPWWKSKRWTQSHWIPQNLGNALRMALLWDHGGVYMDLDVVSMRGLGDKAKVGLNGGGWWAGRERETDGLINNAVLGFPRHHAFLWSAMKEFVDKFDGWTWGSNGPYRITRSYIKLCEFRLQDKVHPLLTADEDPFNKTMTPLALRGRLRYQIIAQRASQSKAVPHPHIFSINKDHPHDINSDISSSSGNALHGKIRSIRRHHRKRQHQILYPHPLKPHENQTEKTEAYPRAVHHNHNHTLLLINSTAINNNNTTTNTTIPTNKTKLNQTQIPTNLSQEPELICGNPDLSHPKVRYALEKSFLRTPTSTALIGSADPQLRVLSRMKFYPVTFDAVNAILDSNWRRSGIILEEMVRKRTVGIHWWHKLVGESGYGFGLGGSKDSGLNWVDFGGGRRRVSAVNAKGDDDNGLKVEVAELGTKLGDSVMNVTGQVLAGDVGQGEEDGEVNVVETEDYDEEDEAESELQDEMNDVDSSKESDDDIDIEDIEDGELLEWEDGVELIEVGNGWIPKESVLGKIMPAHCPGVVEIYGLDGLRFV
ncbi:Lactosylceramide 4-alpha-galactosyltransferase [Blyttiomyces sp. JEL0837]|nr:Lactosylceramide 4-alpha-galactosyltransferase [Blyttiomyces sp. JEL0837]